MFKKVWFQAHWFVGITAGVVLAIVGLTGGILSFEKEIQEALNVSVRKVEPAGASLTPAALTAAVHEQFPEKRVTALVFSSNPADAVRVNFAPDGTAPAMPAQGPGGPRGETRYVNPYTGLAISGEARGENFFRTTRSLHRWLTVGTFGNRDIGKQVVGASTLMCVLLTLSGLYLRWPRSISNWRTWLAFDTALKGRSFLWHLHAVAGTWVLVGFLLMSLTGLNMSYDWFRNGLYAVAGVERPVRRGEGGGEGAPRAGNQNPRERSADANSANHRPQRGEAAQSDDLDKTSLDRAWAALQAATSTSGFKTATLTLPQHGQLVDIRYLDRKPAHERAFNTLSVDAVSGTVVRQERYTDKRTGEKLIASMFPLHSGSFFGLPGTILYMAASLSMPLFAVTGWMMYLDRRKKKRAANAARRPSTLR